jgi:hypothetical protein
VDVHALDDPQANHCSGVQLMHNMQQLSARWLAM